MNNIDHRGRGALQCAVTASNNSLCGGRNLCSLMLSKKVTTQESRGLGGFADSFQESSKEIPVPELSVVMPCLNEAETLGVCIENAHRFMTSHGVRGEIVVADNGSSDGSQAIAEQMGARVVHAETRGYGAALIEGISAARGKYIIMGDADSSYDFTDLMPFLDKLRAGYQLVMGNRFLGGIAPGAMPPLHYYIGNPILTGIGRLFFGSSCRDFHCGLRGFRKDSIEGLNLQCTGMEFASEMVVKATLQDMAIAEVPTTLRPDGRNRPPHLRSWRDGWRHLRFMLMYSPNWLFLYPGIIMILVGALSGVWLFFSPIKLGSTIFDIHTMLYSCAAIMLGYQGVIFAFLTGVFASSNGLLPRNSSIENFLNLFTLETGMLIGGFLSALGLIGSFYAFFCWSSACFGPMVPSSLMRVVIPSTLLLALGMQTILFSFFLSIMKLSRMKGLE